MKKLLLTSIAIFFLITSRVYGTGVEHDRGGDAYESGDFINAYMWLSITPVPTLWSTIIMEELEKKLSSTEKTSAKNNAAKKKGYSSWNEMKAAERAAERKEEEERQRIAADKKAEENKKANTPNARMQTLEESYIDYLIIRNIYEGSSYYVTNSQMNHVKAVTKAIQDYYENSIPIDTVWDRAVRSYENRWAGKINSMNSFSVFNSEFSGFVDLYIMGINSRANRLGISISNTVKDF